MKKFLSIIMVAVALFIGNAALPQTMSQVSAHEDYWNGDTNYPFLNSHMGFTWYLDSSSTVVKKNVSGEHCDRVWAANVITLNQETGATFTHTYWFHQYGNTFKCRIDNGDWCEVDMSNISGSYMDTVRTMACTFSWYSAFDRNN